MEIKLLRQARKYLDKQTDKDAARIREGLEGLKTLQGDITVMHGMKGFYRLRVRDWRAVFTVEDEEIVVHTIGPRGDVYK